MAALTPREVGLLVRHAPPHADIGAIRRNIESLDVPVGKFAVLAADGSVLRWVE